MRPAHDRMAHAGFSYVGLLIAVAILGAASAAALSAGSAMQRRMAEDELLFVGAQFQDAFKTYYEASPAGTSPYPAKLDDLLLDKRFTSPRRHLRKIFPDPLTGRFDWGIVNAPGGAIAGIYSLAAEHPIRVSAFEPRFAAFENKASYSEWMFSYTSPRTLAPSIGQ